MYYIGICNEEGRGIESNIHKAKELYIKASEKGHGGAANNLGAMAEDAGEPLDVLVKHYQKAATAGSIHGSYNWARLNDTDKATAETKKEIIARYLSAAKGGHAGAQNNLAALLQNDAKNEGGLEEAVRWYRNAANQGHANAQFNLGLMILRGLGGLRVDRKDTLVWWGRAVLQDHEQAIKYLPTLIDQMDQEELSEARKIVGQWDNNERVPQLFVIRKGD